MTTPINDKQDVQMNADLLFVFDKTVEDMPIEKDAMIFEAGEYKDKGLTVSEEGLDTIISNFEESPIKVEHVDSPLDPLGTVKRLWRDGKQLFASLAFPADMATFLDRRGVKKLSVGLQKEPLKLMELSLVLSPRVANAAMFNIDINAEPGTLINDDTKEVKTNMSEETKVITVDPAEFAASQKEIADLKFALKSKDVDAKLNSLKRSGKLVPAAEGFAKAIMLHGSDTIKFSDTETLSASDLLFKMLEAQPAVVDFKETGKTDDTQDEIEFSAEQLEVFAKLGVKPEDAKQYV